MKNLNSKCPKCNATVNFSKGIATCIRPNCDYVLVVLKGESK